MIAADGAHSRDAPPARHELRGQDVEQTFLLADVHADTDWPDDEFHIFASGEGLVALFPMGDGRHRLIADHAVEPTPAAPRRSAVVLGEPPLARAWSAVARRMHARSLRAARACNASTLSELAWSSYFHLNSRMVERLRVERVLPAGDAAHVHSPAGAQGMNTGIREAFNLGWKLARVLKGGAPDRLLDTYHIERHPIERDVLRQTSFITQMAEADHGPLKLLRERRDAGSSPRSGRCATRRGSRSASCRSSTGAVR